MTRRQFAKLGLIWLPAAYAHATTVIPGPSTRCTVVSGGGLVTDGLIAQWESDSITGLNNNDLIASVSDQSGQGRTATQATDSKKPIFKTNQFGTKPGIQCDGYAGNNRNLGFTGSDILSGFTFFIGLNFVSAVGGTYAGPFSWNMPGTNNRMLYANAGSNVNNKPNLVLRSTAGGEFYTKQVGTALAFGNALEVWTWNGTSAAARTNGVDRTLANGLTSMDNGTPYGIGVSGFWGCSSIIAAVLMYNRVLSSPEITSNEGYLNGKYGFY